MHKLILLLILGAYSAYGQILLNGSFLNGSFENNLVLNDTINLSNSAFTQKMAYSTSFGTQAGLDILTDNYCQAGSQHGSWYIGMSGGGSDAFSLELSSNLILGQLYQISFHDRFCQLANVPKAWPVMLGLSSNSSTFGNTIYSDTTSPVNTWTKRTFSFFAPNNGKFITVKLNGGSFENGWMLVDNFAFEIPTSIKSTQDNFAGVSVFPNPFQNKIWLQSEREEFENFGVLIINSMGQEVTRISNAGFKQEIDLSFLPGGIYLLNLSSNNTQSMFKIVKE